MTAFPHGRVMARLTATLVLLAIPAVLAPAAQAARPAQDVPPGYIIVRGRLYYTDRLGDMNHPATGLKVEIWDLDSGFPATGEKLDETTTYGCLLNEPHRSGKPLSYFGIGQRVPEDLEVAEKQRVSEMIIGGGM